MEEAPDWTVQSCLPLCSVVVPVYNKGPFIGAALRSALAQDYPKLEIVVIDDGSSDDSAAVAEAIADARIRVIRQANQGVSQARNTGIRVTAGEFVFFLDADDRWHPQHVGWAVHLMHRFPSLGMVATDYHWLAVAAADSHEFEPAHTVTLDHVNDLAAFWMDIGRQRFITSTSAVRRDQLEALDSWFPVGCSNGEDLDLWFRLNIKAPIGLVRERLNVIRRETPNSLSRHNDHDRQIPPYVSMMEAAARRRQLRRPLPASWRQYVALQYTASALLLASEGQRRAALKRLASRWRECNRARWWVVLALIIVPLRFRQRLRSAWARIASRRRGRLESAPAIRAHEPEMRPVPGNDTKVIR